MPSSIDLLVEQLNEQAKVTKGIQMELVQLRAGESHQSIVNKAVLGGAGAAATVGVGAYSRHVGLLRYNGGDDPSALNAYTSGHEAYRKSLGWGGFWKDMINIGATGADVERIHKKLTGSQTSGGWGAKLVSKAPLAEGSGFSGGYTVPVQFYAELMRLIAEESFCRQRCTVVPMQSRELTVPALDQSAAPSVGTSAFFAGLTAQWQPEGVTINQSQPNFRQLTLVARELVFTCAASNQLLQDNVVALDTLLTTLFKEAMAWFMDWYVLRGTGAGQPLGVLNAPCAITTGGAAGGAGRKTSNTVVMMDLTAMLSKLLLSSWGKACWICHPSVINQLAKMTANATDSATPSGQLIWLNPYNDGGKGNAGPFAGAPPAMLFGMPLYFSEKVPNLGTTGDVMLVDLSKVLLGDRLALQVEVSPHVLFQQNQIMWRVIQRWDSQPWLNLPVILGDGSDSYKVSPIVLLGA